ncbi:Ankyrin repeat domain protein [Wolbachia endosymbiont of Drosophila simulans wNo]|uniref:ankyrin repeat domain-containing protein n=1 Tax=unclassified Wolbachia TaxID=2640676 RepID=UPI0002D25733|nr:MULTISPECIES: ankyrin repeat domain-containing protein [unclassified Wolbachia]AGJ99373.1 Ankyrin repeat domain protein [Wolbachia endosymbiont of Drosophila simulans wNo]QCB62560.1 ankyrin repeat domain-containing protein [Wolbachia endosymbiont of Drosophila mauritiana]QCB63607.1 ankyrin repeat domain-containing protein [Wolbachia endosymbiont of Drosophila mauritiana]QWE33113.1 Ankyrin repeat domain protein [Wolbachia endosymbiont of Drosophila simulans]TGB06084.1 ankyrin repeat domain-c
MNPEELQKILAENKKKDSVLKKLLRAVKENDLEKVKSIFEKNSSIIKDVVAEINSQNGTNLLGYAVDSKMAKYLIEQGVKFITAVGKAVMKKDLELVKSICQMNKSIAKNELQQDSKPLESATYDHKFNDKIARYLIEQGANPNATDKCGRCLLHLQIARGNLKGAKALIENGADVNIVNQEQDGYWRPGIDANALKGQTALHFAIRVYRNNKDLNPEKANRALEFISYLIEKKANSNIKDCNEKTPLDTAIFFDTPEIVELLIKAGVDLNAGKKKAEDVLNYAVTVGHIDIGKAAIRYILEHNSRSNKLDLLNNQEELSVYWDEYKAQVKELHDIVEDRIDLTGDGSTRPIMRTINGFLDHESRKNLVKSSFISSAEAPENFCPRKLAVISVAAITCALAIYFLAPLIMGSSIGVGTQLALGAVGAVVGGGIGILTNVAIDQCYVNLAAQKAD